MGEVDGESGEIGGELGLGACEDLREGQGGMKLSVCVCVWREGLSGTDGES